LYDENNVLDVDEGGIGVKKKIYSLYKKNNLLLRGWYQVVNGFYQIINLQYECNYVLFFEFLSHFPRNKTPMMIKEFYNLFENDITYGLNIS
jgi:hypothetical protein